MPIFPAFWLISNKIMSNNLFGPPKLHSTCHFKACRPYLRFLRKLLALHTQEYSSLAFWTVFSSSFGQVFQLFLIIIISSHQFSNNSKVPKTTYLKEKD